MLFLAKGLIQAAIGVRTIEWTEDKEVVDLLSMQWVKYSEHVSSSRTSRSPWLAVVQLITSSKIAAHRIVKSTDVDPVLAPKIQYLDPAPFTQRSHPIGGYQRRILPEF